AGPDRQSVRRSEARARVVRRSRRTNRRRGEGPGRATSVSARDRVRRHAAEDRDGQDSALPSTNGGVTVTKRGDGMTTWDIVTGPDPWPQRYTFSPAVRAGNLLLISGTTASDKDGRIVAPGDIVGQTRYIFQKFEALLRAAGAGFEHIVQTTDYITTTENYGRTAEVRREFF